MWKGASGNQIGGIKLKGGANLIAYSASDGVIMISLRATANK